MNNESSLIGESYAYKQVEIMHALSFFLIKESYHTMLRPVHIRNPAGIYIFGTFFAYISDRSSSLLKKKIYHSARSIVY